MLHTEALAFGLLDPSVWNLYWTARNAELKQRIRDRFHYDGPETDGPGIGGVGTADGINPADAGPG